MCILLVEDEPLTRLVVADELSREGFDVVQAENGDTAAGLLAEPHAPFTALITDIHMPGKLDGIALAERMRAHDPSVPIIYTTGRADVLERVKPLRERDAAVGKPFTPSRLVTVVRRLLGRA